VTGDGETELMIDTIVNDVINDWPVLKYTNDVWLLPVLW